MNTNPRNPVRRSIRGGLFACLALTVALLGLAGCSSPRRAEARLLPEQPTLVADTTFFGEELAAHVSLAPFSLPLGGPGGGHGGRHSRGGHPGGGMGGGGMGGGPRGGMGGPSDGGDEDGGHAARPMMAAPPRITLHVAFTNHGKETLEIAPTDVICDLGNFAVRPERLALAPGQTAGIDPMSSNFPMIIKELSVELRVKRGSVAETRTVRLQPAAGTAEPAQP